MRDLVSFLSICLLISFSALSAPAKPFVVPTNESGVQHVDIKVDSYRFTPDHIIVRKGIPVEIRLRSVTSIIPHNFTFKVPVSGIDISRDIPSGKDRTVKFTPENTGRFEFYCNKKNFLANHRKKGMEGIIEIIK